MKMMEQWINNTLYYVIEQSAYITDMNFIGFYFFIVGLILGGLLGWLCTLLYWSHIEQKKHLEKLNDKEYRLIMEHKKK